VAPLPATRRKDSPPAFGFHARAEAVRFVAAAHLGLKRTLGQRTSPRWDLALRLYRPRRQT
jgi:hypothetical protein